MTPAMSARKMCTVLAQLLYLSPLVLHCFPHLCSCMCHFLSQVLIPMNSLSECMAALSTTYLKKVALPKSQMVR